MKTWSFVNAETGQQLAQGWQGTDAQAHKLGDEYANELRAVIEYYDLATGDTFESRPGS